MVVTRSYLARSRVAAQQSRQGLQSSGQLRLGQAMKAWLRQPWSTALLGQLWRAWRYLPEDPSHPFWPLQLPPDGSDLRPADPVEVEAVRLLWVEWLLAESDPVLSLGKLLADLKRAPLQAHSRAFSRWRSRDREPVAPLSRLAALPRAGEQPGGSALAPNWLAPWLRHSGFAAEQEGEVLLLCLCLEGSLDPDRVEQALARHSRVVCWVVDDEARTDWDGWLQRAHHLAASSPELARRMSLRLGRPVDHVAPAVEPRLHNPFGGNLAEGEGPWESLVREACGGTPGLADGDDRPRVRRMRAVHQHDSLEQRLCQLGLASARPAGLASVFCATSRPDQVWPTLQQFQAQSYGPKEIVLLLHGSGFEPSAVLRWCEQHGVAAQVLTAGAEVTLGECLQRAVCRARGDYLCKWDDDDLYGPGYLDEVVWALECSGAGLVSKSTFPVRFHTHPSLWLLRPGEEFRWGVLGAGSTLAGVREVFEQVAFRPRQLNEVHGFFLDSLARSIPVVTSSRYDYVCRRGPLARHTWRIRDRELQKDAVEMSPILRGEDFQLSFLP